MNQQMIGPPLKPREVWDSKNNDVQTLEDKIN
jgi:hypothetical protein